MLDGARAGTLEGIARQAYDGTVLPVTDADLQEAQVTTRDIDRGAYPHFLLKEITEAPTSFRKTLRGKLVERDGALRVALGDDVLAPERARAAAQRAHRPRPGDRPGHGPRGRAEPGAAPCSPASPTAGSGSRRSRPPSSPASGCGRT